MENLPTNIMSNLDGLKTCMTRVMRNVSDIEESGTREYPSGETEGREPPNHEAELKGIAGEVRMAYDYIGKIHETTVEVVRQVESLEKLLIDLNEREERRGAGD